MGMNNVGVRTHTRRTPSGKTTTVKKHNRNVTASTPVINRPLNPSGFTPSFSSGQKQRLVLMDKHLKQPKDEHAVRELTISADNIEPLYNQKVEIEKNLDKKKAKGNYSDQLAILSFGNLVNNANERYKKDFGFSFDTTTRAHASKQLLQEYKQGYNR